MRRSDWPPLAVLVGLFLGVIAIVVKLVKQDHLPSAVVDSGLLPAVTVLFSVIVAYLAYVSGRTSQRLALCESRRDAFFLSDNLNRMRMLVENNDMELQTVVMILNIIQPHSYDADTLPREHWRLHEDFDVYLDFLEGVAILYMNGHMFKESAEGLWSYYATRLMKVNTLYADTDTIKLRQIRKCMEGIYRGNIPQRVETAWRNALSGNTGHNRMLHDPVTGGFINPLERPIWYYINTEPYALTPVIRMILKLTARPVLAKIRAHIGRRWKGLLQRLWAPARFIT